MACTGMHKNLCVRCFGVKMWRVQMYLVEHSMSMWKRAMDDSVEPKRTLGRLSQRRMQIDFVHLLGSNINPTMI
eukprot:364899-Chlamydomonas_euryale.AAC.17